jgi:hypothetical protein
LAGFDWTPLAVRDAIEEMSLETPPDESTDESTGDAATEDTLERAVDDALQDTLQDTLGMTGGDDEGTADTGETVYFEDPDGVFVLEYPAFFDNTQGPMLDDDSYAFSVWPTGEPHYISIFFNSFAPTGFTDSEWLDLSEDMIAGGLNAFGPDAVEVYREASEDPSWHWVYVEAESESNATRAIFYLEESDGIVAILLAEVPISDWKAWEFPLLDTVNSFLWDAELAREALGVSGEPTREPVEMVPVIPTQAPPTPSTSGSTDTSMPVGKGGLVMLNCLGDVVTVDVIPDGVFQELSPAAGGDCTPGDPIYLDPGEHTLKASIAGVPSQGEATINIVLGEYLQFTWR